MTNTIFVDARKIVGQRTGVGRYTYQLIEELLLHEELDLRLLVRKKDEASVPALSGAQWEFGPDGPVWHAWAAAKVFRWSTSIYFSTESLIVPSLVGPRSVITIHDFTPITHPQHHTHNNVRVHRFFLGAVARRAAAVLVPTLAVQRVAEQNFPALRDKVEVIHEGVAANSSIRSVAPPKASGEPLMLTYVGTVEPRKRVTELVSAFLSVASSRWHLTLIGRLGWLSETEREDFLRLVSRSSVTWRGYVSEEELHDVYTRSDAFAYLSEVEGFGLPVLEALSYGIEVVHSNDDALREVSGGRSHVIDDGDLEGSLSSFLEFVEKLSASSRSERSKSHQIYASSFTWKDTADHTAGVLVSVANRRRQMFRRLVRR